MGAYFQNQVETTFGQDKELFIQEGALIKFMESQYASHPCFSNVVRRLSTRTNEDNTGKVWCVCDYDEVTDDDKEVREWVYYKTKPIDSRLIRDAGPDDSLYEKAFFIKDNNINDKYSEIKLNVAGMREEDDVEEDGLLNGFVVSKTSQEYIDIDKIVKVTEENMSQNPPRLIVNPIAMLTRHSKERMGGGDLNWDDLETPEMMDTLARWYNDDIYWTHKRPTEHKDITESSLYHEDQEDFLCKLVFTNSTNS